MEIVVGASITFFFLFLLTRGIRKRALSELSPFEALLLVTLGDIVQQGITQEDYSLTGSVLAASTFGFWITMFTWASWRSRRVRGLIEGVPIVLVHDGRVIEEALRVEQMPIEELMEAARQQGVDDLARIRLAILEVSGKISIITSS